MVAPTDIKGQKFGKLTAHTRIESDSRGRARWMCHCECGGVVEAFATYLKLGAVTSCGCAMHSPRRKMTPSVRQVKAMTPTQRARYKAGLGS
jgi:hypothetical protein